MTRIAVALGAVRAALGLVAFVFPHRFARLSRLSTSENADTGYLIRLFGARDVVLGAATAVPATRNAALTLGAASDVFDTASAILAANDGMSRRWAIGSACATGSFAIAGSLTVRRSRVASGE